MKKRKIQSSGINPDIRTFFTPPAGPSKIDLASPFANGGALFNRTPSTTTLTPSPVPSCDAIPPSTLPFSDSRSNACSPDTLETLEAGPLEPPAFSKRSALRPCRAPRESTPGSPASEVIILTGTGFETAVAAANEVPSTKGDGNKENGSRIMAAPSGSGAAAATATAEESIPSSSRAMSGFFLVGPTLEFRGDGQGRVDARGESREVEGPNRFGLPTGKSVLGRSSIRDTFPGNSNKIRIGIDAREEGISRSQATIQVRPSEAFIIVTNNPSVPNPIRVRRWTPSPRSTEAKAHDEPTGHRGNAVAKKSPKAPAVLLLGRGQTARLYPGDTLQFDGFRNQYRSKYSYTLHPLPAVDVTPAGVAASTSASTAPPEACGTQASPGISSKEQDHTGSTLTKRPRPEKNDGAPSPSSKSSRRTSPETPFSSRSLSFRESSESSSRNTTGSILESAAEEPFKMDAGCVPPGLRDSGSKSAATLPESSKEVGSLADTANGVSRSTISSEMNALFSAVDMAADQTLDTTLSASKQEGNVPVRDGDAAAESDAKLKTDLTPGKPCAAATSVSAAGRGEGRESESCLAAGVPTGSASWSIGDVVDLAPRVGKGENKLGGVAHVKRVFEDGTYLVKLVLPGAGPTRVSADLLSRVDPPSDELTTRARRSLLTARGRPSPERGHRARVLFDEYDWYMGTVVRVHIDGKVTVRYDEGSEEELTLVPGQAELCSDYDLSPPVQFRLKVTPSRSRGGGRRNSCSSRDRTVEKNWRAVDSWGVRVLGGEDGKVLTKARATALLDTAPEKLIGLTYQEKFAGFGWWVAVVRKLVFGDAAGKMRKINPSWPEAVMIDLEQVHSAQEGGNEGDGDKEEQGRMLASKLKIRMLLVKLHAWDKHCEEMSKRKKVAGKTSAGGRHATLKRSPSEKDFPRKTSGSKRLSRDKKMQSKSNQTGSPRVKTPGVSITPPKTTVNSSGGVKSRRDVLARVVTTDNAVASRKAFERKATAAVAIIPPSSSCHVAATVGKVENMKVTNAARDVATKEARNDPKKQAAFEREAAAERRRTTCPFCGSEFYRTQPHDTINAHLVGCGCKTAAEEEKSVTAYLQEEARAPGTVAEGKVGTTPARKSQATRVCRTMMTKSLSSAFCVDMKGSDLGNLVAAVEELVARGVQPTVALCDRAMQEMIESRCHFRTECLRRLMKICLTAYPTCWKPLNWGVFEETLQHLASERDPLALNAHTAAVGVSMDCIEAFRCRRRTAGGATAALPLLFLGAEGNKDGRVAVKRCAKWASMAWARRGEAALAGDKTQADVCMVMSRVLGESLEAFVMEGHGRAAVQEGCQLVAIEMESHGEVATDDGGMEMTARCRAAMLRRLLRRPFFSTLAEVLLHSMSTEKEGGVEVKLLKAMLSRHAGKAAEGRAKAGQRRSVGSSGRTSWARGCMMLSAD